jgi:hypothetical protein
MLLVVSFMLLKASFTTCIVKATVATIVNYYHKMCTVQTTGVFSFFYCFFPQVNITSLANPMCRLYCSFYRIPRLQFSTFFSEFRNFCFVASLLRFAGGKLLQSRHETFLQMGHLTLDTLNLKGQGRTVHLKFF